MAHRHKNVSDSVSPAPLPSTGHSSVHFPVRESGVAMHGRTGVEMNSFPTWIFDHIYLKCKERFQTQCWLITGSVDTNSVEQQVIIDFLAFGIKITLFSL